MKQKEEMKNSKPTVSVFILFALSIVGVSSQTRVRPYRVSDRQLTNTVLQLERSSGKFRKPLNRTLNQNRSDDTNAENQIDSFERDFENAGNQFRDQKQSYPLSDTELDRLIQRIEKGGDAFRSSLTDAFDLTPYDRTRSEGSMNDAVRRFKSATNQLRNHFDTGQLVDGDIGRLIGHASPLERFMRNNQLTGRAQSDWSTLRGELTALARAFHVDTFWGNIISSQTGYSVNNRLTGTFRLDPSRSDNPREKADRATQNVPDYERQGVFDQILARLDSPETLTIERRGTTVTIASSLAPQATFEADGREREEQLATGRSTRLIVTLRGEQLVVSSNGYRENDFNVTFDATENDRSLRVRRQIYSDQLTQPVVVDSVYDRTADVAQWTVNTSPVLTNAGSGGDFIVRDGDSVVAVLNTDLTTKQAKPGDRFAMTVRQPNQYAGAVIEGTIASVDRGGSLSGRSQMSLNFKTIRLGNGQTYKFAGIIQNIRAQNGETVLVDNEGSVAEGESQTGRTVQRAAIGTAIGAIIGAIAGGGKGAVIGAVVGAAGGAGSVYVQGKDDIELSSGTEVTIRASTPSR